MTCRRHGVVVAAVPWARHGAGFTRAFEDTAAWLAVHTSQAAVAELLRVAWRTVGRILSRVAAETGANIDRLEGLGRIGIDELSHRKGHRYLTVVVDHDSGRLVWAAPATTRPCWAASSTRSASTARASSAWSARTPPTGSPTPSRRAAPRPCCAWTLPRRPLGHRRTRRGPPPDLERRTKGRPSSAGPRTQGCPVRLAEEPRAPDRAPTRHPRPRRRRQPAPLQGVSAQAGSCGWCPSSRAHGRSRCWTPGFPGPGAAGSAFVKLARSITDHRAGIQATLLHGLSNGRVESVNTKLRPLTRIAFGFRSPEALIALAMLALGGRALRCPDEPERTHGCGRRALNRRESSMACKVGADSLGALAGSRPGRANRSGGNPRSGSSR